MNNEEILEGNKLLAQFMGLKYFPANNNPSGWVSHFRDGEGKMLFHQDLKYETSWSSLMDVVEKINTIAIDNVGEIGVYIKPNVCLIGEDEHHPLSMATVANHPELKEMVWVAVKTFVYWYSTLEKNDATGNKIWK